MKKIFYLFTFIALFLSACNPNEEIYDELDKVADQYHNTVNYTLLAADYSKAANYAKAYAENKADSTMAGYIATFQAFNQQYTGQLFIPSILPALFPAYGKKSAALITYNYFADMPEEYSMYSDAAIIDFEEDDYKTVDSLVGFAGYFYPEFNPDVYLPLVLTDVYPEAASGDLYAVNYLLSDKTPIFPDEATTYWLREGFDTGLGQFDTISIIGTQGWYKTTFGADTYAKMAGFTGGAAYVNEDWLISKPIELGDYDNVVLNFTHAIRYLNDHWEQLSVAISTDYDGDPLTATWDVIDWGEIADTALLGFSYDKYSSGDINIAAYKNQTINIAFKYTSDLENQPTWQIYDVTVFAGSKIIGGTPILKTDYYKLEETSWVKQGDVHYLTSLDYDAMGEPGVNDNFSTTVKPMDYLPKYLDSKHPLAGEGFSAYVVYKYYVNSAIGTKTITDKLTYTSGEWVSSYSFIKTTTEQFLHNGDYWEFDPTVTFAMSTADYQKLVDYVKANIDSKFVDSYGTQEYYYGAGSYKSNFDLRIAPRKTYKIPGFEGLSDADALDKIWESVADGLKKLLSLKYPNAVTEVAGVEVHYYVTIYTYENDLTRHYYTYHFQCTKSGPDPEFTQIGEKVKID
ncbi:MAG: choice-of-anchor J domain-containing protein [Bacteroidales bacterium]|jgi:hypothetical protein|nr:choice-of-anchor J domain-containing protein [Bacteroidales bacterium]